MAQDLFSSLSAEERALLEETLRLLIGRAAHREARMVFILDMLRRMEPHQWVWPGLCINGQQQITANLANGRVTSVEVKSKI